ncbi:glycoside hydrolase family 2 protein [Pelagovum pacificum]|uniref:beta-mannosidase n=2 Tax=Pelagovum pacificum TaxID=2588711 RepID=A0A5C5GL05_9RHOB|nr:glycoside hydrolase family 2 protein [Pelagovum pacificum]TNY34409.1 glycoside hydrolase family 2 protein [Pelagovum pacificum]
MPGDVISALHANGKIVDPYWGRNEYDLRWIAEREWTIRRQVDLDHSDFELVVDGLDTVCTVKWNDTIVLETQNSFRTYRVDLSDVATTAANEIEITFHSNLKAANEKQEAQPFYIPSVTDHPVMGAQCPIPNGNMLRKTACDFGWDWNIALAPMGLNGSISLRPTAVPKIGRLEVSQDHGADGTVSLTVAAHLENAVGQKFEMSFAGQSLTGTVENGLIDAVFDIQNPALWWPAGQGDQRLHDLSITVGETKKVRRIGLRKVELLTDEDEVGSRFAFRVNGREIFMKGANWIPADALSGRIREEEVRELLQSAVDANMNMIRIWGGGRYEADWFYDICDELGLMVWQDFMFSCNLYPSTPEFLDEVKAEVRENVARMHHHACLALWCGDNELVGALTWFPASVKDRDRYLVNYDRLNRTIEEELKATDPTAIWWPSSPCPGPMNFGDSWHDDSSGDMHFWSVWHESKDFEHYRDVSPRFCSEFGFQSYPSMEAIKRFAEPRDWNIAAPVFESHQKNPGGNERIAGTMFRYFRFPRRFQDFVWLSQIQQGIAIKTAVEHWRSLKPHCMGTLYWQLNDTWPVCSWASLDHGGNWKMLHHMAKDFFAPVHVVVRPEADALEIVGINDTVSEVEVDITLIAAKISGETRDLLTIQEKIGSESEILAEVDYDALADDEVLGFFWTASDGSSGGDIYAPKPWKSYDLLAPAHKFEVARDGDDWVITLIGGKAPAFFVTVEADQPGRFSQGPSTLFPGYSAEVRFTPRDPDVEPVFTTRDLHSATMA